MNLGSVGLRWPHSHVWHLAGCELSASILFHVALAGFLRLILVVPLVSKWRKRTKPQTYRHFSSLYLHHIYYRLICKVSHINNSGIVVGGDYQVWIEVGQLLWPLCKQSTLPVKMFNHSVWHIKNTLLRGPITIITQLLFLYGETFSRKKIIIISSLLNIIPMMLSWK